MGSHTVSYTPDAFKAELHDRGCRMTPQREVILQTFKELPEGIHASAEDLHSLLQKRGESIGLSTIYRNLKLMSQLGILRELDLADGQKKYEINQPLPYHHHHMVCVRCNKTIEFRQDSMLKIGAQTAAQAGYQLLDCQFFIHAICPSCQRAVSS